MKCLNINEEIINSDRSDSTQTNQSTRKKSDVKDNFENNGFLGENKYPKNIYESEKDNYLTLQIKNALNKIRNELSINDRIILK